MSAIAGTDVGRQLEADGPGWRLDLLAFVLGRRRGKMLDLIADPGFVAEAKSRGWSVAEADVDNLDTLAEGGERFDVITLWDVVGFLDDPDVLRALPGLLAQNGSVVVLSPNADGRKAVSQGDKWAVRTDPARVAVFGKQGHAELLAAAGLGGAIRHVEIEREGVDYLISYTRGSQESSLRALFVNRPDALHRPGGDAVQMFAMLRHLEDAGVAVDVSLELKPRSAGQDVSHLFNIQLPWIELEQMKSLKRRGGSPVAVSPIYGEYSERNWAYLTVPRIFATSASKRELADALGALAAGTIQVEVGDTVVNERSRISQHGPEYEDQQRQIVRMSDHIIATCHNEVRQIRRSLGVYNKPFTVVHNAADPDVFLDASPDAFVEKYGITDFVICVGRFEVGKNQLMLIEALRSTPLRLVLVGAVSEQPYYDLCRQHADGSVTFIGHLPQEELASAYAAARVAAFPSWFEIASLAVIEAAISGCAIVVGDRSSETEYLGEYAWYCDPADVASIKEAVVGAWKDTGRVARDREALRRRFVEDWTWEKAATDCFGAYREMLRPATEGS